jgi:hypothetical protein
MWSCSAARAISSHPRQVAMAGKDYNYFDGEINQKESQWHQT